MKQRTIRALAAINERFYREAGAAFSATRQRAWPGWKQVAACLPAGRPLRVLDLGCGNGRLASFLAEEASIELDYLGIDASAPLLREAEQERGRPGVRFLLDDLTPEDRAPTLAPASYDLVALFGVLHHLPSTAARRRLLEAAAAALAPGGLLALSIWCFDTDDRFESRRLSWDEYNRSAPEPIEPSELEPGDVLLRFGAADHPPRFCHFASEAEIDALVADLGARIEQRFDADGAGARLNHYLLLRRPEARPLTRVKLAGASALQGALDEGQAVRVVLRRESAISPEAESALMATSRLGAKSLAVSDAQLSRLAGSLKAPELLAMVGPDPDASLEEMLALGGAAWLLTGTAYPGNAGFAIRTAEVSGADGIIIDTAFTHAQRRDVRRAAMRADRYFPVHYAPGLRSIELALAAGRRVVAIEDSGSAAPWEANLLAPSLFVVGGERHGIAPELLERADVVLRIPMKGFMPSYNLQAAMASVASERLRQAWLAQAASAQRSAEEGGGD